jgi:hypothetical protein
MFRARWILIGLAAAAVLTLLTACAVLRQPQFGADPEGERLERIRHSPHYVDDEFRNLVATRILAEGQSTFAIIVSDALNPASNLRPTQSIPTTRTDLKALDASRDTVVWLGHSSYFVLFAGKRILIDPVFSSYAGPFSFTNKAFDGTSLYGVDDLPVQGGTHAPAGAAPVNARSPTAPSSPAACISAPSCYTARIPPSCQTLAVDATGLCGVA